MTRILRDFYRAHISIPIRYAAVTAICIGAFFLTGIFSRDNTRLAGIIVSAFLVGVFLWAVIDVFVIAPRKFRWDMEKIPENDRNIIVSGYDTAQRLGARRFYKDGIMLFYSFRRIIVLRYDEIVSAEPKSSHGENIFLKLSDGRTVLMQVMPNENGAMLLAALRAEAPDIKVYINGRLMNDRTDADRKDNNAQ